MFVYMIVNVANGKYYIGKTIQKNLTKYFQVKISDALHHRGGYSRLFNAIRKWGADNFIVAPLLKLTSNAELCEWERFYIKLLHAQDDRCGYNICRGGEGGHGRTPGYRLSSETRAKISEAHKGMTHTPESRAKISAVQKGKKQSPERIENVSPLFVDENV